MTDAATARYGARQQSQGSNNNSWGDDKLNELFRLMDRGSKGTQSLALTGDTVLSWTNYVATNDGQVSILLLTGSLSSAASLTVPSREWNWDVIKNSTGQIITVKTAAGTGVAIPNGRAIPVYCDGADCYNGTGANIPTAATVNGALQVAGQITGVSDATTSSGAATKGQMETAIATASFPATNGTVLNTSADTTAGYLNQKITVSGALTKSTTNPAGNEALNLTVGALGLTDGGIKTADFVAAESTRYGVDATAGLWTATLPTPTGAKNPIRLTKFGTSYPLAMTGLINGISQTFYVPSSFEGSIDLEDRGATRGWV